MPRFIEVLTLCTCCIVLSFLVLWQPASPQRANTHTNEQDSGRDSALSTTQAVGAQAQADSDAQVRRTNFGVTIRRPPGPPRIELAGTDLQGRSGSVACSTCHAVRKPNLENVSAETLDEFHQGMTFDHGKIACYACHNPANSDSLRLADGRAVQYQDVMTLCSQCHGPQATAFAHGAHGGMNGYWDLTRGPQTKNNCVDCHDPHAPTYPKMIVGFKPKDRFNSPTQHDSQHQGSAADDQH